MSSNALTEQKKVLERKSTRTAIAKVEKDSASLIVQHDDGSFLTASTDNLSKLSRIFPFDSELLASKVYDRIWRHTVRLQLRTKRGTKSLAPASEVPGETSSPEFEVLPRTKRETESLAPTSEVPGETSSPEFEVLLRTKRETKSLATASEVPGETSRPEFEVLLVGEYLRLMRESDSLTLMI